MRLVTGFCIIYVAGALLVLGLCATLAARKNDTAWLQSPEASLIAVWLVFFTWWLLPLWIVGGRLKKHFGGRS